MNSIPSLSVNYHMQRKRLVWKFNHWLLKRERYMYLFTNSTCKEHLGYVWVHGSPVSVSQTIDGLVGSYELKAQQRSDLTNCFHGI